MYASFFGLGFGAMGWFRGVTVLVLGVERRPCGMKTLSKV
jgi:hypothetical protein